VFEHRVTLHTLDMLTSMPKPVCHTVFTHTHKHTHTNTHTSTQKYTHIITHKHTHKHTQTHTQAHTNIHSSTHKHTHKHTQTYTHIYTHRLPNWQGKRCPQCSGYRPLHCDRIHGHPAGRGLRSGGCGQAAGRPRSRPEYRTCWL